MTENKALPRERILAGELSELSADELLCVVLGRGMSGKSVFELAREVAALLEKKSRMPTLDELCEIKGLGLAKAAQILACLELSGRFLLGNQEKAVCSPKEIIPQLSFLKHSTQEKMVLVTLNGANHIIKIRTITIGTANFAPLHPREAFAPAIEDRAVAVIFAHNHPSGSLTPSNEDLLLTERMCEAGKILGIKVLDHIIVSSSGFNSIKTTNANIFQD